jgi:hypothetical protein
VKSRASTPGDHEIDRSITFPAAALALTGSQHTARGIEVDFGMSISNSACAPMCRVRRTRGDRHTTARDDPELHMRERPRVRRRAWHLPCPYMGHRVGQLPAHNDNDKHHTTREHDVVSLREIENGILDVAPAHLRHHLEQLTPSPVRRIRSSVSRTSVSR